MTLWPSVVSADISPCASSAPSASAKRTTSPSSRQRMRRNGRTQAKPLSPQRMDFGQGKARSSGGSSRASMAAASTRSPGRASTQKPFCSDSASRAAPCLRRKPCNACSGAPTRGPRSSRASVMMAERSVADSDRRRGPWKARGSPSSSGAIRAESRRDRSSAARACIRAGISSEKSSSSSSGTGYTARRTSVRAKSSPLNSSGSPRSCASA